MISVIIVTGKPCFHSAISIQQKKQLTNHEMVLYCIIFTTLFY